MFWCILYYLGAFGTVWLCYNTLCKMDQTGAKVRAPKLRQNFSQWAKVVQKFMPWSCVGSFSNEHSRSTPLDPNLMFRCVSYYLGAFGRVWLRYKTQCKMGRTGAKVRATKSRQIFSQPMHPIHPMGPWTHVLVHFVQFWCICDRLVELRNSAKTGRTVAKVCATKSHRNFSKRTHRIHPIGP